VKPHPRDWFQNATLQRSAAFTQPEKIPSNPYRPIAMPVKFEYNTLQRNLHREEKTGGRTT
jgi:hypothetical protein